MAAVPLAGLLSRVLAESYALMIKSHNYHWNVTGPYFKELHDLFQLQYEELFLAIDEIAEHIRSCGVLAPGSLREFASLSQLTEAKATYTDMQMLDDLAKSNDALVATCRAALRAAEKAADDGSVDLATQRIRAHSKAAWMLRASMTRGKAVAEAMPASTTATPLSSPASKPKTKVKAKAKTKTKPKGKAKAQAKPKAKKAPKPTPMARPTPTVAVAPPKPAKPGGRPRSSAKASG
ncbi:MAG: Dps family protein [Fimbriimonadaceae bacterium]